MIPPPAKTFEDCIQIINEEINNCRKKWTLTAVQWMDYEDIAQVLRLHIYTKWSMWNQNRPLRPWLHTIISRQIINMSRNLYGNYSRPCLRCSASEGENLCSIYTTQSSACPLYAKWVKSKKNAYDIKLPVALEFHTNEVLEKPQSMGNIENAAITLHSKMRDVLKPIEYKAYLLLFVEGQSEEDVAKALGLKTNERGRQAGYRQLKNLKDNILTKAKAIIYSGDIDI